MTPVEEEMKFMLKWLNFMQKYLDQQSYLANDRSRLPSNRNIDAVCCKLILWRLDVVHKQGYASVSGIGEALNKLKQVRKKENCCDDEGWTRCGMSHEDIATAIWKSWCSELESIPRAGIIFLFLGGQHPAEVNF